MAKSRRKRKKRKRPNVPLLSLLRPRLDERFSDPSLVQTDTELLKGELSSLVEGLNPSEFASVLLRACSHAPAPVRQRLDEIVPEWLEERGYAETLSQLLVQRQIAPGEQGHGWQWLERAGHDVETLQQRPQSVTRVHHTSMLMDSFQGLILVSWYLDERRRKVRGMSFLIDFNPPWEGAIKDVMLFPKSSPERIDREYVAVWGENVAPLKAIDVVTARQELLKCLETNRAEGIRLPRDLIRARSVFLDTLLPLLYEPDTPSFTAEDFDTLSTLPRTPESLTFVEQTMGHRMRLADGTEIMVLGEHFDEEDLFDEEEDL